MNRNPSNQHLLKTAPAPPPAPKIQVEMTQYLICDSSVTNLFKNEKNCVVVQEGVEITGYELYIVEQWACERKLNCVIISYTGNPHHTIVANIVALPQKKQPDTHLENSDWKEKITAPESVSSPFELFPATACAYFEELYNNHVHPKLQKREPFTSQTCPRSFKPQLDTRSERKP